jgi:membrane associated rhomboid family serine protease
VLAFLVAVLLVGAVAYRATTAEERTRVLHDVLDFVRQAARNATRRTTQTDPFWGILRARTRWAPVTPAVVGLNMAIFVLMAFGTGAISAPDTLISWGASFGPRTTNGEWWRLVTMLFVHTNVLHLAADVVGLLAIGLVLERIVGPVAFAAVYVTAGVCSSALTLAASPMAVSAGASGAIFGVCGLALVAFIRGVRHTAPRVPLTVVKGIASGAAVFVLYSLATSAIGSGPELLSLLVGCLCGVLVRQRANDRPAPAMRSAALVATAVVLALVAVRPLHGMTDLRPELQRLAEGEQHMAAVYREAADRFTRGRLSARALATLIERDIIPELHATRARVASLTGIPPEQRPLLTAAETYLRLRDESWRTRVKALNEGSMSTLRQADLSESASLDALERTH